MPENKRDICPIPISWETEAGWIILLPSKLPDETEAGIKLPDSFTVKENSGICVKLSNSQLDEAYNMYEHLLGRECIFPLNQEYRVRDSETDQLYYIVRADQIIVSRIPPKKAKSVRILKGEGEDAAV